MAKKKKTKKEKRYEVMEKRLSSKLKDYDEDMRKAIIDEYLKKEALRKFLVTLCALVACGCLGYFFAYSYLREKNLYEQQSLSELKDKDSKGVNTYINPNRGKNSVGEAKELIVLPEYETLYNKNKSLVGWVQIPGTNIDYPVMQSPDGEYYLDHNIEQKYDKNGSIFMDPSCDITKYNTNTIIYGHHMKSGNMFGNLDDYASESFCNEHNVINFDTIYERGKYRVMYVFRDTIKQEADITFKYYQFIDALSEDEFYYNCKQMEDMSLYDTGIRAYYGDRLLTLSTCDHHEENGRFVVVAKKIE